MLHLKFALNLEYLADEMIQAVKSVWKNPFLSPVVIFPDPKLEQWFRLRWVQKSGTLANFNSMMVDKFLMKILCPGDDSKKKLSAELLHNVMWAYLYGSDEKGEPNYRSLGPEVVRYLEVEGKLDEQHLFDLCNKMSSLFLEYETSRPAGFVRKKNLSADGTLAEGILDRWQQGNLRVFFDGGEREIWQRRLYSQIFHEQNGEPSILTKAFEAANSGTYLTIPFLFKDCMATKGSFYTEQFTDDSGNVLPVFVFGLTGMGQFYRVILQKYAEENEVYAYIQNPCMEFWEDVHTEKANRHSSWKSRNKKWEDAVGPIPDAIQKKLHLGLDESIAPDNYDSVEDDVDASNENMLLCYWGKSGRDNIKLWSQASDYDFDFSGAEEAENLPKDTLLHKIQYMVANRQNELPDLIPTAENVAHSQKDESFTLTGAPTKEREMEALHSRICKLLAEKDGDGNPKNRISDILVFSPNLDDYRTAIFQVFDQNSPKGLRVPFAIVDSPAKTSLTAEALAALFSIQETGSILRPAFFTLVRNGVVQATRRISNDDVSAWETWIENTNTFRIRNGKDDWLAGLRRLLMSRFSTQVVDACDEENVLPYADMMSSNSSTLNRFADCIEDLEEWLELVKNHEAVSEELLDAVATILGKWVSMMNPPEEMAGEALVFQNVSRAFENLKFQYRAGAKEISWSCISQTVRAAAEGSEYSCGTLFVGGVTFCKFLPNRIIPVKHVFFIGADSSSFPGSQAQNALDLRRTVSPWPGDDSPVAKRRYAFLCQMMSAKESFHISYQNKNVVKDEDLYPTSMVNDIRMFLKNAVSLDSQKIKVDDLWPETVMDLDEKRPYSELFTAKAFRNKRIYNELMEERDEIKNKTSLPSPMQKSIERVGIRQLRNFLADPFQFRISQIMNSDDEEEDLSDSVFEPVDFDSLQQNTLLKAMVDAAVKNETQNVENLKKTFRMKGILPDGAFGEKLWTVAKRETEAVLSIMGNHEDSPLNKPKDWTFGKIAELPMEQPDGTKWVLRGKLSWCNQDHTQIADITSSALGGKTSERQYKLSKYLNHYIAALMLIALKKSEEMVSVSIFLYGSRGGSDKPSEAVVSMTSAEACQKLQEIFHRAFVEKFPKALPADILNENISDFDSYEKKLHEAWKYFDKRHLFDLRKDLGYGPNDDFEDSQSPWKKDVAIHKDLIAVNIIPLDMSARRDEK